MPRPPESPDVKASKGLAYILRHGAEKEGLSIRSDGYIRLADVLARPKMREVDVEMVLRLVSENAKQRFQLVYGYDPSPPRPPQLKKGQTPKKVRPAPSKVMSLKENATSPSDGATITNSQQSAQGQVQGQGQDAAEIDDLRSTLSKATIQGQKPNGNGVQDGHGFIELPLVALPIPEPSTSLTDSIGSEKQAESKDDARPKGEYFIRATQGHSINLESTAHLEELQNDEEGRRKAGVMVHGTRAELLNVLKSNGLSKMSRQHIHLAPSHSGAIVPRPNSTLYIYLSLATLAENKIPVYVSANGVVLTPGDKDGVVHKELWRKVVVAQKGTRRVVWEDGKEVERVEREGEEGI
uniref:2'-phosphotransferase n=1 Tax=Kwoniella dejecticola CBS 10117 TaxID=1296121 RepID=A0A1A5ZY58_9TREE|nr:uncharacterized protein I303_07485 [Kwoniella dejecticola CBS 10117]OBR82718.1 hypothetical protein I303_07485 [Kwoniella dejecticola CBS 10117]